MKIKDLKVDIITPCSRPELLKEIKKTIPKECNWIIVYDLGLEPENIGDVEIKSVDKSIFGNNLRNIGLDITSADWVYFLDDDNIIHPDWWDTVKELEVDDHEMINWGQLLKDDSVRLLPARNPKVGNIDTACFMVKNTEKRWNENEYVADGLFASIHKPYIINEYICYYNYLR